MNYHHLQPFVKEIFTLSSGFACRRCNRTFYRYSDIADVVVEALLNPAYKGKWYERTGPELINFKEAVAEISLATKRNIQFSAISMKEFEAILQKQMVPEDFIFLVNYLFTKVPDGRNANITNNVEKVLGRNLKSFKTFAKEAASKGAWIATEKML